MALNPLAYTEKVVRNFLRYQLTTYALADERLARQMRELLSLDATRETPLLQGPYVSLSRAFKSGAAVDDLVDDGIFLPHMKQLIPYPHLYGHQEQAIRAIADGRTTLISTGTGSGKTECFLYPVINRCLELRDAEADPGICAVLVYPMNALAEDQLLRMRDLLAGSRIPFGMYVGKTPEKEAEVGGWRLEPGASRAQYRSALDEVRRSGEGTVVHPPEEVCSREMMRTPGHQPRILLTNVKQLELLLTRERDVELFDGARLEFLVFDEAHTFSGAQGAETACLIRRLRSFCGKSPDETVCVATSATIVDEKDPEAARNFASRFFGVEADRIEAVKEIYEPEVWRGERTIPQAPAEPRKLLEQVLAGLEAEDPGRDVRRLWNELTGEELAVGDWETALHQALSGNDLLFRASDLLKEARPLGDLLDELREQIGREVSEEELILWLTLGAAARREERPLVRPVVHGFVRGVPGAVVTFDPKDHSPQLHLSAEEEQHTLGEGDRLRLPIYTCTTCGQHYYEHYLANFSLTEEGATGAQAEGERGFWQPMPEVMGGGRAVLVDLLISQGDDEETEHKKLTPLWFCLHCGTAHGDEATPCLHCGADHPLLPLQAVQSSEKYPGMLTSCLGCGSIGHRFRGRYREPIKPIRATHVADVHVLAQEMVQHAERKRLLVFADNRQDAAFQAGWMRDHARRYRLRSLIAEQLSQGEQSVGDLVHRLDRLLDRDDELSRDLVPEVWQKVRKESSGTEHQRQRLYLLRILILREITMSQRQKVGLEPWGRLKVRYLTLQETHPFVQRWAHELGIPAEDLANGIAAVLDQFRRKRMLLDREHQIFSRVWGDGDYQIQYGYLPSMKGVPQGLVLQRKPSTDANRLTQWTNPTGHLTLMREIARKWGVAQDDRDSFLEELWDFLRSEEVGLLAPVTLQGWKGKALPHCRGAHQVDTDKIRLAPNKGLWVCGICQKRTIHRTPHSKCLAWHCDGTLEYEREQDDNYDLQVLDGGYTMLRPREHTAMVPNDERERLEQLFKGSGQAVNALVCTQTLELGVDIGALDSVLMRNAPPLPANYWQRSGRAGRRHRMAVNLTYCRTLSHDRAYFEEPLKMLGGRVEPPAFNLSNEIMVGKHVRATVLTGLQQRAREESKLSPMDRGEIREALNTALPSLVRDYLFDEDGAVRPVPLDVRKLHTVITKHQRWVEQDVVGAFQQGWPQEDADAVAPEKLAEWVLGMTGELEEVVGRLHRRLMWTLEQIKRLHKREEREGALDPESEAFLRRCRRLVRKLKGFEKRQWSEAEGLDDVVTFSVLAAEGFLPGYGLESGSVRGMAIVSKSIPGGRDFDLPRPPSIAVREYVPGNLIYANGQRFVARSFALKTGEDQQEMQLEVIPEHQVVREAQGPVTGVANRRVTSIPVCDTTLIHTDRISDEEEYRFQMAVEVYGRERGEHGGGWAYRWGGRPLHFRKGVRLQLVNVGARSSIRYLDQAGYPVCRSCGQSVSPFASERQRQDFQEKHLEWCGKEPEQVAFHADLSVDTLSFPGCSSPEEAYSLAEALRFGAASVLDMEIEDLQILVLGRPGTEERDALLYDPMPGGSGLLQQLCERFSDVVGEAWHIATTCPSLCATSCIDCFQIYRNAYYHEHLNRHTVVEAIRGLGEVLEQDHEIPPHLEDKKKTRPGDTVNEAEKKLRRMLREAQLPDGTWQVQVQLPRPLGSTTPDVTFDDPDEPERKIFVYLDGLSEHIHGNPETAERDTQIRMQLRAEDHDVLEITAHDLDDQQAMRRHFKRLARLLVGREKAKSVDAEAETWFKARTSEAEPSAEERRARPATGKTARVIPFRWLESPEEAAAGSPVPVFDLEAAAGAFSAGQSPEPVGWVEVQRAGVDSGTFVGRAVGRSMEPTIPDSSLCLLRQHVGGSRDGRILLVQHRSIDDPETGGSYTVKRYRRPAGRRSGPIELAPDNPEFETIVIEENQTEELEVIGELLGVLEEA